MPTPPLVVRDGGSLTIEYTTGTPTTVDLSCFAFAVEPASDVESIDIGTFCTPNATDQGKITESIVISMLWSADLYTALQPHIGEGLGGHARPLPRPGPAYAGDRHRWHGAQGIGSG